MFRRSTALILIAFLTCLAGAVAAPGGVAPDGTFEKRDAQGAPVGWQMGAGCTLVEEGGNHFLRVVNAKAGTHVQSEGLYPVPAEALGAKVSARFRARDLKVGKESYQTGRIQLIFTDAAGKMVGKYGPCPAATKDTDWVASTVQVEVPEGAVFLKIQPALFAATGTLDVDDIQVAWQNAGALPEGESPRWGEEPVETLSGRRAQVCLNGLWHFLPAVGQAQAQPEGVWGYLRVPGNWQGDAQMPGLVSRGKGGAWEKWNPQELSRAWYERKVKVPADWAGRAILLDLQRVSTDAVVIVNGVECGKVEWPAGTVDITRAVKPGEEATLRLLVVATPDAQDALVLMGPDEVGTRPAKLQTRGIIGDVLLMSRPAGAHVSDVFVRTSTRRKELALDVEVTGARQAGPVQFVARVLDEQGKEEKRFTAQANVAAGTQTVTVAWPWANPRLWDVGKPNRYTLKLQVKGAGLDDEYSQEFGFREFWIEGRRFFLNGTEIRLRPIMCHDEGPISGVSELMDAAIDGMLWAGFNIQELWPSDHDERGSVFFRELWADRADRKGWPLMGPSLSMARYIHVGRTPNWTQPGVKERWEQRMAAEQRRYRNHPSILMYATSGNISGHGDDQNPRRIGMRGDGPGWRDMDNARLEHLARCDEAVSLVKKHDPTRPVLIHQGGPVSDVYALNSYLCMIPLQEREEWLSHWAKHGEMPYLVVEWGTPLAVTMMRGRQGYGNAQQSEPLVSEFTAVYLGSEAYRLERPEYRAEMIRRFEKGQQYQTWHGQSVIEHAPAFQKLLHLFGTNTWRSWRTMGITGGMVPWSHGHGWKKMDLGTVDLGPFQPGRRGIYVRNVPKSLLANYRPEGCTILPGGQAITANNGPTLAWIAGPAEAFTAKDHHFAPRQKVSKQVVLINDSREAQAYSFTWQAVVGGKAVAAGEGKGTLATAQTLFLPLTFTLSPAISAPKVNGEIRLTATIGKKKHEDRFPFRVFGRAAPVGGAVTVFDPAGRTTRLLRQLGYSTRPWQGQADTRFVVIGRGALSGGQKLPGDLEAFVQGGGRALVCAQEPQWIERFLGLRTSAHLSRRVFPVDAGHPVVAGLDTEDLRDWAGVSDLVEAYPDYISEKSFKEGARNTPWWGWHWGNRGAVATGAIEKPHHSSWQPILECEFDLAYTPLMALEYGKGRLVWSQLDLEDHAAQDPAAAALARRVLRYAETAPVTPKAERVIYLGDAAGAALLDSLGLRYRKAEKLESGTQVAILGAGAAVARAELEAYLQGGGKALVLARSGAEAPLGVSLAEVKGFGGSLAVPNWPECRGLSASDLRWRADQDAWLVTGGCTVGADGLLGRLAVGPGVAIFCQIDPNRFAADEKTYFRITRWRQTRALAQVLANLGASFALDGRVFAPRALDADQVAINGKWRAKVIRTVPSAPGPEKPNRDPGISAEARALVGEGVEDQGWDEVDLPQYWVPFERDDGEAVFRRVVDVPAHLAGKDLLLSLGPVDDFEDTFFNGVQVGHSDRRTPNFWNLPRVYPVPGKLVKAGRNVIAVRLFDHFGSGGFGGQRWQMLLKLPEEAKPTLGFYHPDYRADHPLGDDPYRYYRW